LIVIAAGWGLWRQLGYHFYVVHTGSMVPTYRPGDLVLDRRPSGQYHRGEVITFRHSDLTTDVVTHRVTDVTRTGLIHTKGDANVTPDVWDIRPDQVKGTAAFRLTGLGYVVVFLRQPAGIGSLATGVFTLVLLWQLFFPPEGEPDPQPARRRPLPAPRPALA
jgi:signal peptidase